MVYRGQMKPCQGPIQPRAFTANCSLPGTDGTRLLACPFVVFRAFPRRHRSARLYVVDLEPAAADVITQNQWILRNIQEIRDCAQQSSTLLRHGTRINPLDTCSTAARLLEILYKVQAGSNMTGTDFCVNKPHYVPVIFEPACTIIDINNIESNTTQLIILLKCISYIVWFNDIVQRNSVRNAIFWNISAVTAPYDWIFF